MADSPHHPLNATPEMADTPHSTPAECLASLDSLYSTPVECLDSESTPADTSPDSTPPCYTPPAHTPPAPLAVRWPSGPVDLCRNLMSDFDDVDPLKTRVYGGEKEGLGFCSDFCVICQTPFSIDEELGVLQCGHEYHANCIHLWLHRKNLCPLCNQVAVTEF